MIKVLIVNRHELVRSGIKALLSTDDTIAVEGEASCPDTALSQARKIRPDIILLDVNLSGLGVLETTRRLLRLDPAPRIVAFGGPAEGPYPACLLETGVAGYLSKFCTCRDLLTTVHKAHGGRRSVSSDVAQSLALGHLSAERTPIGRLTPRELAVMVMVSQGHNRIEISNQLCVSPKTVSTYRTRLLRKLGASSDVELTHLSLQHGLIEAQAVA